MATEIFDSLESLLKKYPKKEIGRAKNLTNQKFNRLTAICRVHKKNPGNNAVWACRCDCGNYIAAYGASIMNGHTSSCSCLNKEIVTQLCKEIGKQSSYKDYTKVENPYYNFIEPLFKKDNQNNMLWKVQCKKCNSFYEVAPSQIVSDVRNRGNNPCRCWQFHSKGADKIYNLLKINNLSFETEVKCNECIFNDTNKSAIFDFKVYTNNNNYYYIEYDGEQHFKPMSFGDSKLSGEEKLLKTQEHDRIKNQYCINNNIPLIRIPYTHYNNICINDLILEKNKFLERGRNDTE